jgi:DNA-binding PadR family transcriptional regulator
MDTLNKEIERLTELQKQVGERLELLKKEAAKQEEETKEEKPEVKVYIVGADGTENVTEALKAFVEFMKGIADDND